MTLLPVSTPTRTTTLVQLFHPVRSRPNLLLQSNRRLLNRISHRNASQNKKRRPRRQITSQTHPTSVSCGVFVRDLHFPNFAKLSRGLSRSQARRSVKVPANSSPRSIIAFTRFHESSASGKGTYIPYVPVGLGTDRRSRAIRLSTRGQKGKQGERSCRFPFSERLVVARGFFNLVIPLQQTRPRHPRYSESSVRPQK